MEDKSVGAAQSEGFSNETVGHESQAAQAISLNSVDELGVLALEEVAQKSEEEMLADVLNSIRLTPQLARRRNIPFATRASSLMGLTRDQILHATSIVQGIEWTPDHPITGEEEVLVIEYTKRLSVLISSGEVPEEDLKIMMQRHRDVSFGWMLGKYKRAINRHSSALSKGNSSYKSNLESAGMKGLSNGIMAYRVTGEYKQLNPGVYLDTRIKGAMKDRIRDDAHNKRSEYGMFMLESLDQLTEGEEGGTFAPVGRIATLLTEPSLPFKTQAQLMEQGTVRSVMDLLRTVPKRGTYLRDLAIFMSYNELFDSMSDEEITELRAHIDKDGRITMLKLGEMHGVTESRVSQIVKTIHGMVTEVLETGRIRIG